MISSSQVQKNKFLQVLWLAHSHAYTAWSGMKIACESSVTGVWVNKKIIQIYLW